METDKEKFIKERQELLNELQKLDQRRNEILMRLIEIQGVIKYIEEGGAKEKEK